MKDYGGMKHFAPIHTSRHSAGFTLVELTIVILMLAILAALAMPKITQGTTDSVAAAAGINARAMATRIAKFNTDEGRFPTVNELDPNWFASKRLPLNPFRQDIQTTADNIAVDNGVNDYSHPIHKFIRTDDDHLKTFWYNPNNGRFRALVDAPGSSARMVELYNKANGSNFDLSTALAVTD
jgi:prepilin-type N-terminal cleavage/methylation domain-containing protein